ASGMRLELDLQALPLAEGLAEVAAVVDKDPRELAATGGEDFELCVCVAAGDRGAAEEAGVVAWIGTVRDPRPGEEPGVSWAGRPPGAAALGGFEHQLG